MTFDWIREHPAHWDADKARIIGGAPPGALEVEGIEHGSPLPGDWWRVEEDGTTTGYGWIDEVWGDAEMLVAVDPAHQRRGVGTFVLDQLEREVARRGVNYLFNVVPTSHPDRAAITAWLQARSFEAASDSILRRRVAAAGTPAAPPTDDATRIAPAAAPVSATDPADSTRPPEPITFDRHPDRYRHWRLDIDAPVATLTLQVDSSGGLREGYDLKLNSYDLGVDIELADAVQRLRFEHPEVRAVVVTGGLDKVFCAGANIGMLATSSHDHKVNFCKFTNETRNGIEDATDGSRQTWLAAVNGTAAGGGYELALACDEIILIDDRSSAVSLPEVPLLAVLPGTGGLTRVVDKRHVRRDRADVFATRTEGIRGAQAVEWGLVDAIAPRSRFDEEVRNRALARAAASDRPTDAVGIELATLDRTIQPEGDGDTIRYPHLDVRIDRELGAATITVHAPTSPVPTTPDAVVAAGSDFWPLAVCRALDDAVLHLRFNENEVGTWVFGSRGDAAAVLAVDEVLAEHHDHWLVREILLYWRRTLSRIDMSSRTLVTLVEPGSCFAGTLAELVLAADRSYMLEGTFEHGELPAAELTLTEINDGRYAMANGLSRLASRFYGHEDAAEAVRANRGKHLLAAEAAELGLVTFTPDDIDWDDDIRLFLEERASFSPDALTGMEANYRFVGPETMQTKIFGRLTAWQNWIFQRPNAAGPDGALRRYGTGSRPVYDRKRV